MEKNGAIWPARPPSQDSGSDAITEDPFLFCFVCHSASCCRFQEDEPDDDDNNLNKNNNGTMVEADNEQREGAEERGSCRTEFCVQLHSPESLG
jgi:hypothetical protein